MLCYTTGKKTSRRSSSRNDDYHKTTIDKILPKSSSKELARLGVSESMPDLRWKDLRRRRTMALVKVCFSQHLDEITIKQQKKVNLYLMDNQNFPERVFTICFSSLIGCLTTGYINCIEFCRCNTFCSR